MITKDKVFKYKHLFAPALEIHDDREHRTHNPMVYSST